MKCPNCGYSGTYSKEDVRNVGTFANAIWQVTCSQCKQGIETGGSSKGFPQNKDLLLDYDTESGGIKISKRLFKPKSVSKKAADGQIPEYPIQYYFKESYKDYGFKNIEGPFRRGPDFTTIERGRKIGIEVEREWESYIEHKHHKNPIFDIVKYLVVLKPGEPPKEKRKLLPKKIIPLDIKSFVSWSRHNPKGYYDLEDMQLTLRIELIADELIKSYANVCPDKNRDMAFCPQCKNCAYEPEINFSDWALEHIISMDYPIWDDKFSLSNIDPRKLDTFFKQSMRNYFA